MTASSPSTPVLIVGGGLAGLSSALFLAARGVRCIVIERHPASSPHPRAIGFTPRTLELLRSVGVELPQVPAGTGRPRRVVVESLAGAWGAEADWTPPSQSARTLPPDGLSPVTGAAVAQDRLEPILREKARSLGADVRMNTELVSFTEDADGLTAELRTRDGAITTVRASYLIAADGHRSAIRERLGIARSGHGVLRVVRSVLFRADLEQYLDKGISQFELNQPGLKGMLTTYRDGRWLLMFEDDQERDEATLRAQITRAIGRTDVPFELITTGRWTLSALIADRFSKGRVFLAGDAAHTLPPARGGYGANTGIEDAFNLAWKLAAVLDGTARAELLDSYDAERRPIAWLRFGQIFARRDYADLATETDRRVPILDDDAIEFGQLYRSQNVLGASADLPPARRPDEWAGQPGTRAPHLWVLRDGERVSTLDVLQREWVLISEDERWRSIAHDAGISFVQVGSAAREVAAQRAAAVAQSAHAATRDGVERSARAAAPEGVASAQDAVERSARAAAPEGVASAHAARDAVECSARAAAPEGVASAHAATRDAVERSARAAAPEGVASAHAARDAVERSARAAAAEGVASAHAATRDGVEDSARAAARVAPVDEAGARGIEHSARASSRGARSLVTELLAPPIGVARPDIDTPIEQLVEIPGAKAVLETHFPQLLVHESYPRAKSLSLRALLPLSRGLLTQPMLDQLAAALAKLPDTSQPRDDAAFRTNFRNAFGLTPTGASLIRPDGYVAWRATELSTDAHTEFATAVKHVTTPVLR